MRGLMCHIRISEGLLVPGPLVPGSLGPWVPESLGPRVPWSLGPWVPGPLIWFVDKLLLNLHFMQSLQRIRSRE